jgi:FkbM family methyltransferase
VNTVRTIVRAVRDSPVAGAARPMYRRLRTQYLRWRYPKGAYLATTGIPVYCDFNDASYVWYDAASDYLAFQNDIVDALVERAAGNVFIDVGAHFGYYTARMAIAAAHRHPTFRVIALEADASNYRCLQRTMAAYRGNGHIELIEAAAGDRIGTRTLFRTTASCTHTYADAGAAPVGEAREVTIDTLTAGFGSGERTAVIKIDVDGAEPVVLAGARETIARDQPLLLVEFSPVLLSSAGFSPQALFAEWTERFTAYRIDDARQRIVAVRPPDYDTIAKEIGAGIVDLILCPEPIDWTMPTSGKPGRR